MVLLRSLLRPAGVAFSWLRLGLGLGVWLGVGARPGAGPGSGLVRRGASSAALGRRPDTSDLTLARKLFPRSPPQLDARSAREGEGRGLCSSAGTLSRSLSLSLSLSPG